MWFSSPRDATGFSLARKLTNEDKISFCHWKAISIMYYGYDIQVLGLLGFRQPENDLKGKIWGQISFCRWNLGKRQFSCISDRE